MKRRPKDVKPVIDPSLQTVILIGCGAVKASATSKAKDLYLGSMFQSRLGYVMRRPHCRWFILSGLYGVLDPERVIEPYEYDLRRQPVAVRRIWTDRVIGQLLELVSLDDRKETEIELHAGAPYAKLLQKKLQTETDFAQVSWIVEGLTQGRQMRFYSQDRSLNAMEKYAD